MMLVAARLRHVAGTKWGAKRYMNMDKLRELTLAKASTQLAQAAVA
jgi:putative transposase